MNRYFYDCEFVEDGKTIELISIGIVADDGREYYAVNSDAPWDRVKGDGWLVRNVLPSLPITSRTSLEDFLATSSAVHPRPSISFVGVDTTDTRVRPHWVIANEVRDFLLANNPERDWRQTELWGYHGAYDHVSLCWLWGPMTALPEGIPMWTNDIMQAAAGRDLPAQAEGLHNALEDARHVHAMWRHLQGVREFVFTPPVLAVDRLSAHLGEGECEE